MEGLEVGLFFGGKREGWGVSFGVFVVGKGHDDGDEAWGLGMGGGGEEKNENPCIQQDLPL